MSLSANGARPFQGTAWPIFIISLAQDEQRRRPLLDALTAAGLRPEVLVGVDGRKGLPAEYEAQVDRQQSTRYGRPLTDGELACALSHRLAYAKIVNEELPGAIILEDDAIVGDDLFRFISEQAYYKADFFTFGHRKTWVRRGSGVQVATGLTCYRLLSTPIGAYGYCLNQTAARHILRESTPVKAPADWPCDITKLDSMAMDPQLVDHPKELVGQSHLEETRRKGKRAGIWNRKWKKGAIRAFLLRSIGRRIA